MATKKLRITVATLTLFALLPLAACAKVPENVEPTSVEIPLPSDIDGMDSSQLVPTDEKANCRKAPALKTAAKHKESEMVGAGVYGTYDWAAGKTNGGQIWKTRLAYAKTNLAQIQLTPTYTQIGNVGTQLKLAKKVDSIAYVNGDFFHLRQTNLVYSAMVEQNKLVYSPKGETEIVGVVEEAANEHTGVQGPSTIKSGKTKIAAQGLNLVYLATDGVGVYNELKTTEGLPTVDWVVKVSGGVVTSSKAATEFKIPTVAGDLVFVARGLGKDQLKVLREGDQVEYIKPKNAKTTRFIRTGIQTSGTVSNSKGDSVNIVAVNDRTVRTKAGVVLFTAELYPKTSALSATVITDSKGVVTDVFKTGRSINVAAGTNVLQFGTDVADFARALKVGDKLKVDNSYKIKKDIKLFASFGNRENAMINGVIIAKCTPSHEDIRPRNVIGWNENGDVWFATTTMGVRNSADVFNRFRLGGSTVHQLTTWLKEMGATQAVMLDGGGSTTMYIKKPNGDYLRNDLPASEWVRNVPQGLGMVLR